MRRACDSRPDSQTQNHKIKMKTEPARIRQHGTRVSTARTAAEILEALRLVTQEGFSKINGVAVDITTAGMVVNITAALNEGNRAKWLTKIDSYLEQGKDPAAVLVFWINTFWKLAK
jgi:hypothetical protein